jgi:hypothetical protein
MFQRQQADWWDWRGRNTGLPPLFNARALTSQAAKSGHWLIRKVGRNVEIRPPRGMAVDRRLLMALGTL